MLELIIDRYISPMFSTIGIIGNAFMLSILFRWITNYHINFNFCHKISRRQNSSTSKSRQKMYLPHVMDQNSVLNYQMCIYLTFLSIADFGYLLTLLIRHVIIWKNEDCGDCIKVSTNRIKDMNNTRKHAYT